MTPETVEHVHVYEKIRGVEGPVSYFCVANCTHTIPVRLMKGKQARCPYCDKIYTVSQAQLRKKRVILHCDSCTHPTKGKRPGQKRKAEVSSVVERILMEELGKVP